MAIGPVGTSEYERLTTRLGRDRFLRRRAAGFGEKTGLSERIALAAREEGKLSAANGTMCGRNPRIAAMAAERAKALLATRNRRTTTMTLLLSVPEGMAEAEVRNSLRPAYEAAAWTDVTILRSAGDEVLAHAVACGPGEMAEPSDVADGDWHIVMSGTAGTEGTLLLYDANEASLQARYPKHFLQSIAEYPGRLSTADSILAGFAGGAAIAEACGDGGVYGALWRLGERLRAGMRVSLPEIPISQLTIEICETLDRDPYQIPAGGSALFVTAEPERLIEALAQAGVEATDIGVLAAEAARILENRDEERFLEPYRGGTHFSNNQQ